MLHACALLAGGAHERQGLCGPPSDRRRARGTLRTAAGTVDQRTRGEAVVGPGEHCGRAGGLSQRPGGIDGGGSPSPCDETDGRGQGDLGGRECGWDPARTLFIGPFIEHAIEGRWRRHRAGAGESCAVSEELRRIAGCRGHAA